MNDDGKENPVGQPPSETQKSPPQNTPDSIRGLSPTTTSTPIKPNKSELLHINDETDLDLQIATADVVALEDKRTGARRSVWKRPLDQLKYPCRIKAIFLPTNFRNPKEVERLVAKVKRIKKGPSA